MTTFLSYHDYKYYPYERVLALREAARVLGSGKLLEREDRLEIEGGDRAKAEQLTYFSKVTHGRTAVETVQSRLERAASGQKRQATRYSVHGLHEYKGKFNPQIVKALLNICGIGPGSRVLDPFCGSGTTLIEAAHLGATAEGFDINPFAVFLANAKLSALRAPADRLEKLLGEIFRQATRSPSRLPAGDDARADYLGRWFTPDILVQVEAIRSAIKSLAREDAPIFEVVASNLLRDYSLQDPNDLRIRRRKSPLPETPFAEAFYAEADRFIGRLRTSQEILGKTVGQGLAVLRDTAASAPAATARFDAAITSPPYAMALPYIDTQRLSLVWLGLSEPDAIASLESTLVGSREMRGGDKRAIQDELAANLAKLPPNEIKLCRQAAAALSASDGFRRKAVPALLYRYFTAMQDSFRTVLAEVKPGAPYILVVGHNHTVLGGKRIDIDTPAHLASLAEAVGWNVDEMIPLQTYQRWGYHAVNAVAAETLIILRRP